MIIIFKAKGCKIDSVPDYSSLMAKISSLTILDVPVKFNLKYKDSDGDLIMLGSDEDYKAMIDSESSDAGIEIFVDDGHLEQAVSSYDIVEIPEGKIEIEQNPFNLLENKPEENQIINIKPNDIVLDQNQQIESGCFHHPEVFAPQKDLHVIPNNEVHNQPAQNMAQVPRDQSLKIEDIRTTMIDVLKSNFPDILSMSLRNALPIQQPNAGGLDPKLKKIISTILSAYRELSIFEKAKIDEPLDDGIAKLFKYFEDDEEILPPKSPVIKKQDSENVGIYGIKANKPVNEYKIPQQNIPIFEEKKVNEPKPEIKKPFNIKDITSESVIFPKPNNLGVDEKIVPIVNKSDEKKQGNLEYSCQYVKDINTLPKIITVNDSTILKTIALKNNGSKKWPEGSTLEYVSGLKFKAIKMIALDAEKEFSTVIQIESPKLPGVFSCILRFACLVDGQMTYPNDPFALNVEIEGDKKAAPQPQVVDNELPKDWAAKLKLVKEIIPDVDEKKVFNILKGNPKASSDDIVNELFN